MSGPAAGGKRAPAWALLREEPGLAPDLAAAWGAAAARRVRTSRVPPVPDWADRWVERARRSARDARAARRDLGPLTDAAVAGVESRADALAGADGWVELVEGATLDELEVDPDTLVCTGLPAAGARVVGTADQLLLDLLLVPEAAARAIAVEAFGLPDAPGQLRRLEACGLTLALEAAATGGAAARERAATSLREGLDGTWGVRLAHARRGEGADVVEPHPARVLLRACVDAAAFPAPSPAAAEAWTGALGAALLARSLGREGGSRLVAAGEERLALEFDPTDAAGAERSPPDRWAAVQRTVAALLDGAVSPAALAGIPAWLDAAGPREVTRSIDEACDLDPVRHPLAPWHAWWTHRRRPAALGG